MQPTRFALAISSFFIFAGLVVAGGGSSAKIGDWIEYAQSSSLNGQLFTITVKQTLIAKDDTMATLKADIKVGDKQSSSKETKVSLDKLKDPAQNITSKDAKSKLQQVGKGKETVQVGTKKLDCDWVQLKGAEEANGKQIEVKTKIWTSTQVPLSGMVKMESETPSGKSTLLLTDFGNAK